MRARILVLTLVSLAACSSGATPSPAPAPAPPPPAPPSAPTPPTPAAPDVDGPHGRATDVCGQILVVAWHGAEHAPDGVTRTEQEAQARANELRARIAGGTAFADVATAESDAPTSRARGGMMGTFAPADWPAVHAPLLPVIQALHVGELGAVTRLPYGFVIPTRCEVRKVHVAHILVRYHGARNADDTVTRTSAAARADAQQIHDALAGGADFAQAAREKSEDGSAAQGGDLGWVGLGMFQPEFERAAFALAPGQLSPVVETAFGFHVIKRVE